MADALTRSAVIAATRDLIQRDGLDRVSLRRVAASLGVTAPALYAYVRDERDLLRAVADDEFAALIQRFRAVVAADPLDRTRAYCRAYVDYAVDNPELFKVMFLFRPRIGTPGEDREDLASATEAFALPSQALREAAGAGLLRRDDLLVTTLTTWAAMHGIAELLLMGFDFDQPFREHLINSTIDMVLHGISR